MSILVDWEIRQAIKDGSLVVDPFDDSLINPASLDFRLGDVFAKTIPSGSCVISNNDLCPKLQDNYSIPLLTSAIDPTDKGSFTTLTVKVDKYILMPGEFVIATTLEAFQFNGLNYQVDPNQEYGLASKVAGKSSLGRLGFMQSSVAGWVDPGFKCDGITLELFNYSNRPLVLRKGMKVGQLVLIKTELPNKDYSETGRYQGQGKGAPSKGI